MNKHVVLISKDVLLPEYLQPYGGKYWETPNITELAMKGTLFLRHYTAAPSTAMAFTSMFTGLYPYETNRSKYIEVDSFTQGTTLFDEMNRNGYQCHLMWSSNYVYMAEKYSKCFGVNTIHHDKLKLNQSVGQHIPFARQRLSSNSEVAKRTFDSIINQIQKIDFSGKTFLWIHLPHVMLGRAGYGQDIDLLDRLVGELRNLFSDEGIYITADHGHMNGDKGKTCYGFDVYERAIRIPLITPRIEDYDVVDFPTSNIQLSEMILRNSVSKKVFVVSDSAYYAQPFRKIAIIKGNHKLIYNKHNCKEELYDVVWDPSENNNLLEEHIYDRDRFRKAIKEQVIFYPYRDHALSAYSEMQDYFRKIWKVGKPWIEARNKLAIPYRVIRSGFKDAVKGINLRKKSQGSNDE
jgi:hypothetical protein